MIKALNEDLIRGFWDQLNTIKKELEVRNRMSNDDNLYSI